MPPTAGEPSSTVTRRSGPPGRATRAAGTRRPPARRCHRRPRRRAAVPTRSWRRAHAGTLITTTIPDRDHSDLKGWNRPLPGPVTVGTRAGTDRSTPAPRATEVVMASPTRTTSMMLALLAAMVMLSGCSGADNGSSESADKQAPAAANDGGGSDGESAGQSGDGDDGKAAAPDTAARALPAGRDIVYRGQISVRVKNVTTAANKVESLTGAVDGVVFSEETSNVPGFPEESSATLTLRVPPTRVPLDAEEARRARRAALPDADRRGRHDAGRRHQEPARDPAAQRRAGSRLAERGEDDRRGRAGRGRAGQAGGRPRVAGGAGRPAQGRHRRWPPSRSAWSARTPTRRSTRRTSASWPGCAAAGTPSCRSSWSA